MDVHVSSYSVCVAIAITPSSSVYTAIAIIGSMLHDIVNSMSNLLLVYTGVYRGTPSAAKLYTLTACM